ncbi:MAG: iron-sulfur cluster repair di-iron protein [Cyanobacteria bacterium SZAS LIN-3]|nr:iron-sulfur cluster repair di-iron protein [Cyanobacteria bacterium SZAS LIN-3]
MAALLALNGVTGMKDLRYESVGELVAEQPALAEVFDRYGIDFCCGGKQTLEEACVKALVDPQTVLMDIKESSAKTVVDKSTRTWVNVTLTELTDHIQQTHHTYLKAELPRLQELADKVARVHGVKDPRLVQVAEIFSAMRREIEQHTEKEDLVLFPFIRQLDRATSVPETPFVTVANPIRCMESEHSDAGEALMQLRDLTEQYTAPERACTSWIALLNGLAHLDQDLRTHIHKENTILFPKAIEAESALRSVSQCKQRT